jgi:hypothetical protein
MSANGNIRYKPVSPPLWGETHGGSKILFMKFLLVIILALPMQVFYAQINLVPNHSFEEHIDCPNSSGQIDFSLGWYGINTVEYYHECAQPYGVNVPYSNGVNFQFAKSGVAYSGFGPFFLSPNLSFPDIYREWIGIKLMTQLKPQVTYCASFNIVMHNFTNVAISNFGILLSPDSIFDAPFDVEIPYPEPQIQINKGIYTDTINWTLMNGSYKAQGNEKYLIIGNFLPSDSVEYQIMGIPQNMWIAYCPFGVPNVSYYLIDDVSLYELNKLPQAQNHAYNCAANTVTLKADTGFNFRWYYLPDTVNVLSTADTFVVDASTAKHVLLRATLCSSEFTDTVFVPKLDCTSIEDNALAQGASLFPNPAGNVATFSLQGVPPPGTQLHLTDLNGRELRSFAVTGKNTEMDVSTLANGVYFVRYQFKENVIWKGKLCKFGD